MSEFSSVSLTVFLHVNSLAHFTLFIWGCLGQQIIQLQLPDDTDTCRPHQCPQIKITASLLTGLQGARAGKRRGPRCLAHSHPPAGPWGAGCAGRGSVCCLTTTRDVLTVRGTERPAWPPFARHGLCPPPKALLPWKTPTAGTGHHAARAALRPADPHLEKGSYSLIQGP